MEVLPERYLARRKRARRPKYAGRVLFLLAFSPTKLALYNEIRARLEEHIKGHDYVLANYLVALMESYPATDPYQHEHEK